MRHNSLALIGLLVALLAIPGLAPAATRVSSDSNCPASDAISQQLLGLLASGGPTSASARVHREGDNLRIELSTPGEATQERSVPASGECAARAELAALIIAAWLDAMPAGAIGAPGVPPRAVDPTRAASHGGDTEGFYDPENPPLAISTHTLVGAAMFGLTDSLGATTGWAVEAAMPNLIEAFGLAAEASLSLPRQMSLGQGTVHYWRPTFGLGGTGELRARSWAVRPQASVVLGVLSVSGTGYQESTSATTVTWGASVGVRVVRAWRRAELWLRADGASWPQGRTVRSRQVPSGPDLEVAFPEWELRLALGFSWGVH